MWTDEAKISTLIFSKLSNPRAQSLAYQSFFQIQLIREFGNLYFEAKQELDFHNFARTQSSHMTEGIFGTDIHTAKMETAKVKAFGYLMILISSAHKFLRSLSSARKFDRGTDWGDFRNDFREQDNYRRARNAIEHFDQAIASGIPLETQELSFSVYDKLNFKDSDRKPHEMDISRNSFEKLEKTWEKFVTLLESR